MNTLAHSSRLRLALLLFLSLVICAAGAPADLAAQHDLSETQQIIHVLNRLGYGPRPGDIERVKAMGVQAYIEQQLLAETIPDPVVDERLAGYSIVDMTFEELVEYDRPATARAVRRRESAQRKAEMVDQMTSEGISQAIPERRSLLNARISGVVTRVNRPPGDGEIFDIRLLRAVYSARQLLEMMVDFWVNHFNIFVGDLYLNTDYTERVIRPRALGKFEDLLVATAKHPAMLLYLDNWLNSAPEKVVQERLAAGHPVSPRSDGRRALAMRTRKPFFDQAKGLNENYARELMELHTLGVDGGYTQEDVIQVAKSFTGWTVSGVRLEGPEGTFMFDSLIHEEGDKVVLGQTIESAGIEEGMQILKMLAHHPSTARFISTKLVRRFVADDPPAALVDAASQAFERTGGDIREVLRAIFTSPEFFSARYYHGKIKKPLEMVASALRAVNADIDSRLNVSLPYLYRTMSEMGEPLYQHRAPDGFPDFASAWISTNALFKRMDFAMALATGQVSGVAVDLASAQSLFQQLAYPEPTPRQMAQARSLVDKSDASMMGGAMMDDPAMMQEGMMQRPGQAERQGGLPNARVIATALALGSPRFQKR